MRYAQSTQMQHSEMGPNLGAKARGQADAERHLYIPRIYKGLGVGWMGWDRRMLKSAFSEAASSSLSTGSSTPILPRFYKILGQKQKQRVIAVTDNRIVRIVLIEHIIMQVISLRQDLLQWVKHVLL